MNLYFNVIESPVGPFTTVVDESGAVHAIEFGAREGDRSPAQTREVDAQLQEFFEGKRKDFDLKLADIGTPFQKQVWALLRSIPFGETRSYGELAIQLGNPGASRAVGRANATNPIPIVVPCHRVIGSTGKLTGFAGGLSMKEWLLRHEGTEGGLFAD